LRRPIAVAAPGDATSSVTVETCSEPARDGVPYPLIAANTRTRNDADIFLASMAVVLCINQYVTVTVMVSL
jgi:hypothetical protein